MLMKKIFIFILTSFIAMSISISVSAKPIEQNIDVTLSATAEEIKVGETVALTAVSLKHGSSFEVLWLGAEDKGTILDTASGNYISTAVFTADKPGVYTLEYKIIMRAGKSNTYFTGSAVHIINIINPVTVAGAEIKNLAIRPVTRSDGSIAAYSAIGDVYILWSDNTGTLYNRMFFFFGPNETVKNVNVTFNIDGITYTYTVPVERK